MNIQFKQTIKNISICSKNGSYRIVKQYNKLDNALLCIRWRPNLGWLWFSGDYMDT